LQVVDNVVIRVVLLQHKALELTLPTTATPRK